MISNSNVLDVHLIQLLTFTLPLFICRQWGFFWDIFHFILGVTAMVLLWKITTFFQHHFKSKHDGILCFLVTLCVALTSSLMVSRMILCQSCMMLSVSYCIRYSEPWRVLSCSATWTILQALLVKKYGLIYADKNISENKSQQLLVSMHVKVINIKIFVHKITYFSASPLP